VTEPRPVADPWAGITDEHGNEDLDRLVEAMGAAVERTGADASGDPIVAVDPARIRDVMTWLRDEAGYEMLTDVTAVDYPEEEQEVDILLRTTAGKHEDVAAVVNHQQILQFQSVTQNIAVSREVAAYAAALARATRPAKVDSRFDFVRTFVDWGAGPRAGQAMLNAAKALAAMDGRPAVAHADVREMAPAVLRHRLGLNYRARTEGLDEDALIRKVLETLDG